MTQNAPPKLSLSLPEFVALMAFLTSLVALSIDAMLPALAQIGDSLHEPDPQRQYLIVSLFFFGMAFGQFFFGPLSDARGRRVSILVGLVIFAIGTLVCMFSQNLTQMLIGRVIQAFGVSGPRIAALAVIRDKYEGEAMARVMSFMMMVFILVPMVAPLVGQGVMLMSSWRHIFTFFLIFALFVGCWFFIRQPETLPPSDRKPFKWAELMRSTGFILTHKKVMGYTIASGFIFGAFLAYLSASQAIFQSIYDTGGRFPLYFALLAFSIGLASFVNGKLVMRLGMYKLCNYALLGFLFFSSALTYLAWRNQGVPPLSQFVGLLFAAFFCVGILFGNLGAISMQPLGHIAGLGAAVTNSLSGFMSVPIAIFIGQFIENTITPVGLGFIGFNLLAMACIAYANTMKDSA